MMPNEKKSRRYGTHAMKKTFWRRFFKRKRKAKKQSNTSLTVNTCPKKHKTEPDRWKPPFATKETLPLKIDNQDLVIVSGSNNFELGRVTATIGIMLQAKLDYAFQLFVDNCLERFKNLDWGGVNEKEKWVNDQRIMTRMGTVYGVYTELSSGTQIWIATDLEQGITRICLSDER